MEGQKIVGVLIVAGAGAGLLYYLSKKNMAALGPGGATAAPGAPAGVLAGLGGSLASLLSPGRGGPATVNAGGRTIAPVQPTVGLPRTTSFTPTQQPGSSGSFPNIIASAAALINGLAHITPGPSQAPTQPVDTTPVFSVGQTQGLADLAALTARTQDQLSGVSTYDALPSTLVDPGYGSPSPDLAAQVTGLDSSAVPTIDFSALTAQASGGSTFDFSNPGLDAVTAA